MHKAGLAIYLVVWLAMGLFKRASLEGGYLFEMRPLSIPSLSQALGLQKEKAIITIYTIITFFMVMLVETNLLCF